MTRYAVIPLLLSALTAQASDVTQTRWQGQWGDGFRDALTLAPLNAGQMKVHYWRKLDADYQQAELQFDAIATIAQTEPLTLDWKIEGDPQQGTMHLTYQAEDDAMALTYQSTQQGGTVSLHRSDTRKPSASSKPNTLVEPSLSPQPGSKAVTFTWQAPAAKAVFLAGEMNDWQADTLPMVKNDQGQWQLTVYLEPGRWSYKLVQDGLWLTDTHNPLKHADGQGGYNSMLQVGTPDPLFVPRADSRERGTLQELSLNSHELGARPLLLYRPAGVKPDVILPWALVLHGYGMDRHQWVNDGDLPTLLDNLIAQNKIPPMALLMVDGGKSFYQGPTERFLMQDLLPHTAQWGLSETPSQRALLGVSMGGFGAFNLAYRYPNRFATSVSLSGFFDMGPLTQWDPKRVADIQAPLLYCGEQDKTSLKSTHDLEHYLRQAGVKLPFHYAAGGHTWHYWQTIMPAAVTQMAQAITPSGQQG
jgi:enterochelin esterase-like enzyme